MKIFSEKTFQGMILILQNYWAKQGCSIIQPIDIEVGAATCHPMTCLYAIGNKPVKIAYVQLSRRPSDGRYANNSNRLQQYYQFQVIMKPPPHNFQFLYFQSLEELKLDLKNNDIRFIDDNWENPTLGAYGIGWEIWLNGIEITQFTYFQQMGGIDCDPITGEITYGLERLAMHIQNIDNIFHIIWNKNKNKHITYGDYFYKNELEQSIYNFEHTDINFINLCFQQYEKEINILLKLKEPLIFPAYEKLLKALHCFNLLEARKFLSHTERQRYVLKLRSITKLIVMKYHNFIN
ncbi:glycine--tRNA ligase subunit alpha [Enterobacteriaceae endosymbiont of Donacia cincticornis]|uniref:glycine--tRNA ligase subunit alpha n=1 Tax=Enterobacteriaceae endosymbiont of Donacia cincticornis TaxID=2675773 RepID=UPI00144933F8|nr:glycine--tRNA ligase subunit alpha [Enterobacteriaceae endosymbiont of Donacia cincticornis]QJC35959.1 glycine--tRNA ligase subunit alpha [Enterobacteriaceae endosymbiont of Donacia cincticornis]